MRSGVSEKCETRCEMYQKRNLNFILREREDFTRKNLRTDIEEEENYGTDVEKKNNQRSVLCQLAMSF